MQRRTLILSHFLLCNIFLSGAEEQGVNCNDPSNKKLCFNLSTHTRVYCGACSAAGKTHPHINTLAHTHTSLQATQWTHTSVGRRAVEFRGTELHVIAKQTRVQCPLIEERCSVADLLQQQSVFPLPFLSHLSIVVQVNDWYFTETNRYTATDLLVMWLENPIFKAVHWRGSHIDFQTLACLWRIHLR